MATPRTNASHDQNFVTTLMGVSTTDGTTPVPVEVDPVTGQMQVSSSGGGGGASTIADGADVAEGATTDVAVTAGSTGTVSGKLRQISADIATSNSTMSTSANQTNGTQKSKLVDTGGTNIASISAAGALKVDNSAVTQPVSGTVTANMGTVTADPFGANADAASATGSISAKLRFIAGTGIPITGTVTVGSHAVTNAGTFAVQATSVGDIASGSSDSGNPVKIGGVGKTANPTAITDGNRVNATFDKLGKQVVVGSIRDLKVVQQTTITSSTSETTIGTAVVSTFLDLYGLIITNTSATVTKVTIKDSTAGTTRAVIEIPATETRGFMLPESGSIPQATVNNNWTATCGTSVASVEITALMVKNT